MIHSGNPLCVICVVIALSMFTTPAVGQETKSPSDQHAAEGEEKKDQEKEEEKEEEKEDKKEVEVSGLFEATESSEVIIQPKEWSSFTVVEAVEHGEQVEKGDVLIRLDTDKIDDAIRDAEAALKSEELTVKVAEIKFDIDKRNHTMSLEAAKKADRIATEDMKEFISSGRDRRIESAERSVKSARDSLEYQQEELRQLEKMYKADDLTEDTEEIILKRTRDQVDRAKYFLDSALRGQRTSLTYSIPRAEEEMQDAVKRAAIALEQAQRTAEDSLAQKELALEKQRHTFRTNQEKLERLREDRDLHLIRAPANGVVYYGGSKRGKWSDPSATAAMLVTGGALKPKVAIMTIVKTAPLNVRLNIPEASKRHFTPGVEVSIVPVAYPDSTLKGTVKSVSAIPVASGVFDAVIEVDLGELRNKVMPGMKATIKRETESE